MLGVCNQSEAPFSGLPVVIGITLLRLDQEELADCLPNLSVQRHPIFFYNLHGGLQVTI